jgi:hypothetical protein
MKGLVPGVKLGIKGAQFFQGGLAGNDGFTKVGIVEAGTEKRGQGPAGGSPFSHYHGDEGKEGRSGE